MDWTELFIGTIPWVTSQKPVLENNPEIIFTRFQYPRNFADIAFLSSISEEKRLETVERAKNLLIDSSLNYQGGWSDFSAPEKKMLEERFILGPLDWNLLGTQRDLSFDLAGSKDGALSVFINLKEHFIVNNIIAGLPTIAAAQQSNSAIKDLLDTPDWSQSDKFGYLTADPRNAGGGLRMGFGAHFPATFLTKKQDSLINTAAALGFIVSPPDILFTSGDILQLTLKGSSRLDPGEYSKITQNLTNLISVERDLQHLLFNKNKSKIEDKIFRAWWTLKSARLLSYKEFLECSSLARLGIYLELLPVESLEILNVLQVKAGPGHIQLGEDASSLTPVKMDETRAVMVRLSLMEYQESKSTNP